MSLTLSCISDVILVTKLVSITVGTLRSKLKFAILFEKGLLLQDACQDEANYFEIGFFIWKQFVRWFVDSSPCSGAEK